MRTLLLADDSNTIQKVVNLTFADEGFEVVTASDGDTALRLISEHDPAIILADVNIPGTNGYEICRAVRENEETKDTPVVLLVGSFEPFDAEEAARVGASGHLTKPFSSIRQLVATVLDLVKPEETKEPQAEPVEASPEESGQDQTEDIHGLYQESFAETVEMPHTIAERYLGDTSMDDEEIETTYPNGPPTEEAQPDADEAFGDLREPEKEVSEEEFLRNLDEQSTEISFVDRSEEETLFEAVEERDAEQERSELESDYSQRPVDQEENVQSAAAAASSYGDIEQTEPGPEGPPADEGDQTPTPWDSVAVPHGPSFEFDDSNLLDLPDGGIRDRTTIVTEQFELADPLAQSHGISQEVIDRIADSVAVKITEQMVREIAARVIPEVLEAAIAGRHGSDEER